jgi:hypothetical protein
VIYVRNEKGLVTFEEDPYRFADQGQTDLAFKLRFQTRLHRAHIFNSTGLCFEMVENPGHAEKTSYLPDWLLDMKKNISNSKEIYTQTNQRIEGLKSRTVSLGNRIGETRPNKVIENVRKTPDFLVHDLPMDTFIIVARYLDLKSLVIFENISKVLQKVVNNSDLWFSYFKDMYPDIILSNSRDCKKFIVDLAQYGVIGIKFVRLMSSNRSLAHSRSFETQTNDLHLQKVETMTKDFRTFALVSLRALSVATCHEKSRIHSVLLEEGIIRVLISLLSNESCLIQQYACDIISNMLSWEALTLRTSSLDGESVSTQLQICDGRRQLLSLLTSPSATVILSQSIRHDHPYRNEAMNGIGSVTKTTASVQGMANQSASRALVNYFCFDYPILSQNREDLFQSFGQNSHPTFEGDSFRLKCETEASCLPYSSEKSHPWRFMYYHRSGFLKDTHDVWILLSKNRDSLQARGVDEIGPFLVRGTIESGFGNFSWHLDKYYLQSAFLESSLESLEVWIQNVENYWLDDEEFWSIGRKSVSHVGYRSSQVLPQTEAGEGAVPFQINRSSKGVNYSNFFNREEGLWGVWETATIGSHYELQKGGVFRAILLS